MDFEAYKAEAEAWCVAHGYVLISADDSDRQIIIVHGVQAAVNFSITCPMESERDWLVWSDLDRVRVALAEVNNFCQTCNAKSLSKILDFVHKSLSPLLSPGTDDDIDPIDCDGSNSDPMDDDDDDVDYYPDLDDDVDLPAPAPQQASAAAASAAPSLLAQEVRFSIKPHDTAAKRLVMDLNELSASETDGIAGEPRGDNLFVWDVKLTNFPKETSLAAELQRYSKTYNTQAAVTMEISFPPNYPMSPPFIRVLKPRFKFLTGHVTRGGSICTELLTQSGWRPVYSIESILVQVRSILAESNGEIDLPNSSREYPLEEAKQAFNRMKKRYGW